MIGGLKKVRGLDCLTPGNDDPNPVLIGLTERVSSSAVSLSSLAGSPVAGNAPPFSPTLQQGKGKTRPMLFSSVVNNLFFERRESSEDLNGLERSPSPVEMVEATPFITPTRSSSVGSLSPQIQKALKCFISEGAIRPAVQGQSGSRFVIDPETGEPVAIAKLSENERGTPIRSNEAPAKYGIRPGESAVRGLLAYQFSLACNQRELNVYVPQTISIEAAAVGLGMDRGCESPTRKTGTLQIFEPECISYNQAVRKNPGILQNLSQGQIQEALLVGMLLYDADGHGDNILIQKDPISGQYRLVLIDLGCILPKDAESGLVHCLGEHVAAKEPLTENGKRFIEGLKTDVLSSTIENVLIGHPRRLELKEELLQTHQVSLNLIQIGLQEGLSLYDLYRLMQRKQDCKEELSLNGYVSEPEENINMWVQKYGDLNICSQIITNYKTEKARALAGGERETQACFQARCYAMNQLKSLASTNEAAK